MDVKPNNTHEMQDYELNEALDAQSADELDGLSIQNQRLARIQEYEEAAVARPDPFAAVIGMGNASLQRVFEHLGAAVLDQMDSCAHSVQELRELAPEIRLLVKLRNSIEADLAYQGHDAELQLVATPHRKKGNGLSTKVATSKRDLLSNRRTANTEF